MKVAILGTGRANYSVSYNEKEDKLTNRLLMPVALSYDHRVIDGADGARFTRAVIDYLGSFPEKELVV